MCVCDASERNLGHWKCCCCCSLTVGLIVFMCFIILGLIANLILAQWWEAAIEAVFLVPYVIACLDLSSPVRRKWVFISNLVYAVIVLLIFVMFAIFTGYVLDQAGIHCYLQLNGTWWYGNGDNQFDY